MDHKWRSVEDPVHRISNFYYESFKNKEVLNLRESKQRLIIQDEVHQSGIWKRIHKSRSAEDPVHLISMWAGSRIASNSSTNQAWQVEATVRVVKHQFVHPTWNGGRNRKERMDQSTYTHTHTHILCGCTCRTHINYNSSLGNLMSQVTLNQGSYCN